MKWELDEAIDYYKRQGAPGDQNALVQLLREVQEECGGIAPYAVCAIAESCGVKESYLLALIRRIPRLRLANTHLLEICAGPNCGKHRALADAVQRIFGGSEKVAVKFVPCMRMCGKGPNVRWDGKIFHQADEKLLHKLAEESTRNG